VKTLSPRSLAVIVALLVVVGVGGVLLGRSLVDPGPNPDEAAVAERGGASGGTASTAPDGADGPGDAEGDGPADPGGVPGGATGPAVGGDGEVAVVAEPAAVIGGEPVPATSETGDGFAYTDPEEAREHTGTVPPPVLPATVKLSGTQGLRDGDPVNIRIDAEEGSQVFAFTVHLCRRDAKIRNDYDFLSAPGGRANCTANPLSPRSDGPLRFQGEGEFRSVQGTFRVGVGTDRFETIDGTQGTISCGPGNPCKLVLKIQVPYGFGYQEFPITYA
jgi:hypothetical protein